MTSQTGMRVASRKTFRTIFCVLLLFCATLPVVAQTGNSGGRFPVYDGVKRQFDDLKPALAQRNLSKRQLTELSGSLKRMDLLVGQLIQRQETSPNNSQELILRLRALSSDIKREQGKLSLRTPVNPPDRNEATRIVFRNNKQTYVPDEYVEVQVSISKNGVAQTGADIFFSKWIGLMRSSEPHRNISYWTPIRQYQGQATYPAPRSATFKAPSEGGQYEIRVFDRESGIELASAQFKVDDLGRAVFIAELEKYKAEVDSKRDIFFTQWDWDHIEGTYTEYFRKAGSTDPRRYVDSWIQNGPWVKFVSGGSITDVVFRRASEHLGKSIYNLKNNKPFTRDDVVYYRRQMELWRPRADEVQKLMVEYAQIVGERQTDLLRINDAPGMPSDTTRAAYNKRDSLRTGRLTGIAVKFDTGVRIPVFGYAVGDK